MSRKVFVSFILSAFFTILLSANSFGQGVSPQTAMSDSFSLHSYPSIYPASAFWGARWQKGSLSNCTADSAVSVNYNQTDGQLQISPLSGASQTHVNGFVSKWKMDFRDSFTQVEVPAANGSGLMTTLSFGPDCDNWYQIARQGSVLQFRTDVGGNIVTLASIAYDPAAHQYWRMRHNPASDAIVFETGEVQTNVVNGSEKEKKLVWTQRAETTVNFSLVGVKLEIGGGTVAAASNPAMIKFDNFLFDSNDPLPKSPQQTVDTTFPDNSSGTVINVANCSGLQTAFNAAQPGDTVRIDPTLSCTGNFNLPVKSNPGNKWIVIRSASSAFDPGGAIPQGVRVNGEDQSHRGQMPKLLTGNRQSVLEIPAGANYYRLVGIEFGIAPNFSLPPGSDVYSLVGLAAETPQVHHVVIDRCYFRGELTPNKDIRRAIALNGAHLAVIDSYLSKLIDRGGFQNQAIGLWSGTGPIRIENNYLEALAQNILMGGDSSATPDSTLTDVVIRRNHFNKSLALYQAWGCSSDITNCPALPPTNGIEIKQGRRIRISENIFENSVGDGIYVKSVYESGCVFCISEDIHIKDNKFINSRRWVYIHGPEVGSGSGYPQSTSRVTVENNLSYFTDMNFYQGSAGAAAREDIPDVRIIHNTYEAERAFYGTNNLPTLFNFEMRDNLTERRTYGLGGAEGLPTLNTTMFPYTFRRNLIVNNSENTGQAETDSTLANRYPCPAVSGNCGDRGAMIVSGWDSADPDGDQVGFAESSLQNRRNTGNYRLAPSSSFSGAGTDGKDIGADIEAIDQATAGVRTGLWTAIPPTRSPYGQNTLASIEVENFDNGGENVAYKEMFGDVGSGLYRSSPVEGVDILQNSAASNGFAVYESSAGEWLEYTLDFPVTRSYNVGFRYSSAFNGGKFHLEIDGADVTGPMTADSTGGWNSFGTVLKTGVNVAAGPHVLRLVLDENAINPELSTQSPVVANFDVISFSANVRTPFDYDGDGRADISVYRPTDGNWYLNRSSAGFAAVRFGAATDVPVPADFDGDGKTDIAVWRPSTGVWYILNSADNTYSVFQFGVEGDVPVQADYDGDGRAEVAVWRPSDGVWYIREPENNGVIFAARFGLNGDRPAVGDFDGDSRADFAVFRPSNGFWYIQRSLDGNVVYQRFGLADDKIVPADFDGDGKTDITVWRPSTGVWYRINSSDNSLATFKFGNPGDLPSAADFDGDGRADEAAFRPSGGTWYCRISSSGSTSVTAFGTDGDTPTTSAFVR
ncbi:MAG: FG-GAP-like repeat-containing protein [Pyrinomonadaceae bacterium]